MFKIEKWAVVYTPVDVYKPREVYPLQIKGLVFGNPKFSDGYEVVTSAVQSATGRVVKTRKSEYLLGEVDPEYLEWYRSTFPERTFDPENPVTVTEDRNRGEGTDRRPEEAEYR